MWKECLKEGVVFPLQFNNSKHETTSLSVVRTNVAHFIFTNAFPHQQEFEKRISCLTAIEVKSICQWLL